jgi:glycosyltransferase involved in cell wall biosynthesis
MVLLNTHQNQTVTLAIASARNNFTERLEHLIHELKAEKYVNLLGFVSDSELGSLMHNSVGFVFPSFSEGFGLPGLEALNVGTLLLASNIPVFKEIYMNHAFYFNQLDFSSIEKVMRDALKLSPGSRSEIVRNSQEFVKRYSWDKMARQTLQIYEAAYKNKNSDSIRQG